MFGCCWGFFFAPPPFFLKKGYRMHRWGILDILQNTTAWYITEG